MSAIKCCRFAEPSENVEVETSPIDILDYDSLSRIFMQLPISDRMVIEKVCSKWEEASKLSWYDIKKFKCTEKIDNLKNNPWLTQPFVEKVLTKCGIYINELSLSKVCNSNIMPHVVEHCKNLTSLEFVFSEIPNFNGNEYLAFERLDKLKSIKIRVDESERLNGLTHFQTDAINNLPVKINEIHLIYGERIIRHRKVCFNLNKFTNLHSLTLRNCRLDKVIEDISKTITLVNLDLQDSWAKKTDILFNKLVNLQHVSIMNSSGIFDAINILQRCCNLKYLKITCRHVHEGLAESALQKLAKLKNLEFLMLPSELKLRGETMTRILNNCNKLKHLEMTNCTINPEWILDESLKLQHLEYLNLSDAKGISNSSIIVIAYQCKNLKYLNINNCNDITERTLMNLTNLEKLDTLNVGGIDGVTDEFIIRLKRFKSLDLHNCKNITDYGVLQLIKNCPVFEHLNLEPSHITFFMIVEANQNNGNPVNDIISYLRIIDF